MRRIGARSWRWVLPGAAALLAGALVLPRRTGVEPRGLAPGAPAGVAAARGPAFALRVERPHRSLPLFGLVPDVLMPLVQTSRDAELELDQASPGARIGDVGSDRLRLGADGWELAIETDGEGRIAAATHLDFPYLLGGARYRLRCRPGDSTAGYLRTTPGSAAGELDGRFFFQLAVCEDAESGKTLTWPQAPLTVTGSFAGLPKTSG
ncbi:MAG: hypothetical protein U0X73_05985 [Thermoanaerobaculia bacterium]